MRDALWIPDEERKSNSQMSRYMDYVNRRYQKSFSTYQELYDWSVSEVESFWSSLWDYFGIIASAPYTAVCDDLKKFPGCEWFTDAKLNYAENMLRWCRDKDGIGMVFCGEGGMRREYSRREIYSQVTRLATALRNDGVKPGDVVAGYLPNLVQTILAMLAATAIGAVWCSCATDIGPAAAVDRIGQVNPVVLITADGYSYKNKAFDVLTNAKEIAKNIPSVRRVVVTHYAGNNTTGEIPNAVMWDEYLAQEPENFCFEQLPASHPLVVMFSSGTTGKPKCMVQSAVGLLMNQLKELVLHSNICEGETLLYITSCSWMMWNWQAAAIGTGAKLVVFDGNPSFPDDSAIWKIVEQEKVTVFGLSASYIHGLMSKNFYPMEHADLHLLKSISQTGSALSDEGFAFIYEHIKRDVHFNSIAGGTDINGCFAIGNPLLPVYAGELQAPGLGMKIECYDDDTGKPTRDAQGQLVCECPAPSMPLKFWNDHDGARYHAAYFEVYPNIWHHGDYVLFHGDTGGVTFYGRSDSILKPSGVRIGTAEIYNQVDKIPEVVDSLAIGQNFNGDQRVLLFVLCKEGVTLDDDLQKRIKTILRTNASPRHVPARMIQVPDIPRTLNGKKVESAVTNIINGRKVTNRDALSNPDCLDFYYDILPDLQSH